MPGKTTISWSRYSWNPFRGCRRVSPGCEHCFAEQIAYRFSGPGLPYEGLIQLGKQGPRWNGEGRFIPDALDAPLHWRDPSYIFVNSMSDLFFERFTNEEIAAVFGVMAACPWHAFQILTKRPARALEWFAWLRREAREVNSGRGMSEAAYCLAMAQKRCSDVKLAQNVDRTCAQPWPLPNVWIGVSVEDQQRANERMPLLVKIPAAVRFVSYEPALEAVDFDPPTCPSCGQHELFNQGDDGDGTPFCAECGDEMEFNVWLDSVDLVIVGGESGGGARPFDLAWARSVVAQCDEVGTKVFVKQLGKVRIDSEAEPGSLVLSQITGSKGDDPAQWPPMLRRQELPALPTFPAA